ncbi:Bacteriophage head to tail connecting protein [Serratia entomophila]|uniref:portal protein n=1 Tax=Serratia entomophila TaxID=42906 RepID=UPI00217C94E2|nr:portal protein [Serratia entomophila]CAI1205475.1 Bacteriophage head to tail connecting protein [Serratia entomophila]CAI2147199.1 Bacteriophage head to tail connecting protein [Serratia entomophila]
MAEQESRKQFLEKQLSQLVTARTSYDSHWKELSDFILPNCGRFLTTDAGRNKRNTKVVDPTGGLASRTLESGMLSGITSPTRPWFSLSTPDKQLMDSWPVKMWLSQVVELMNDVMNKSNWYQSLTVLYRYLGTFATGAISILEDEEDVIRTHVLPIGSYYISNSDRLQVDTVFRKFSMTCRQLVAKFGLDNVSDSVKSAWDTGAYETWFEVVHAVLPNTNRDTGKLNSKNKRYSSVYYESGGSGDKLLSESGFDEMPILVPRWDINGEDAYGSSCPGILALGGVKALQLQQKRKDQAIDKLVNPPMVAPSSMKNERLSLLPGDVSYVNGAGDMGGFKPAYEINPRISELLESIQDGRQLTNECYFVPLFNMFSNINTRSMPIEAVNEMRDEKMLQIGPVLDRLNDELLDPAIDRIFNIMNRRGMLPPPPEELQGQPLRVEYTSVMAQAQKAVGIGSIERFVGFIGNMAAAGFQQAVDKLDVDQAIDEYGDMLGVPTTITKSDEQVQAEREQRAQQQQAAQNLQMGAGAADIAKTLSQSGTGDPNLLTSIQQAMQQGQGAQQ